MTLTPEQKSAIEEAQKKAMDKIYADIAECDSLQKLVLLILNYYKTGYDDGQKVIVQQYLKIVTSHSEKLNATIEINRPKTQ